MDKIMTLNLQLFSDGGAEGAAPGGQGNGEGTATVVYGVQPEAQSKDTATQKPAEDPTEDRNAAFEALIKGEYKEQYASRVESTVKSRLKGLQGKADSYDRMQPLVELMARKYGIAAKEDGSYDQDAIMAAAEEDDSWLEEEASRNGISVEQQRKIRKMEQENAQLREQMRQQQVRDNADRLYAKWMDEAKGLQATYQGFNLDKELQNQDFVRLLQSGVSMEGAFKAIHMDDLMRGGMQFAVEQTAKQAAARVAANGTRPRENGSSGNAATVYKSDVTKLTDSDLDEVIRRVKNGERISFG